MFDKKFFILIVAGLMSGCHMRSVVTSPVEKRGISGFAKDSMILLRIKRALLHHRFANIKFLVQNRIVLLCGFVQGVAEKDTAEMVVDSISSVKKVINEVQIRPGRNRSAFGDIILSQMAQSSLFLDMRIASRNYHITVVGRVLYVLGMAQSVQEKQNVLHHLRNVSGVVHVVDHIFTDKKE